MELTVNNKWYKDVSKSIRELLGLRELKKGEVVHFKLLHIPMTKTLEGDKVPLYPASVNIPLIDEIYDYEKQDLIPISYGVRATDAQVQRNGTSVTGVYEPLDRIEFGAGNKCTISISWEDKAKLPLLYFLRSHSLNKSNPLSRKRPNQFLFEELKPVLKASDKLKYRKKKKAAEETVLDKYNESEVIASLKALKLPVYNDDVMNREALIDFIDTEKGLNKFLSLTGTVKDTIGEVVEAAMDNEFLAFNDHTNQWTIPDLDDRAILTTMEGENHKGELIAFMLNEVAGQRFYNYLVKMLEAKKAVKAAHTEKVNVETGGDNDLKNRVLERQELDKEYKRLFGKAPMQNWRNETVLDKIKAGQAKEEMANATKGLDADVITES